MRSARSPRCSNASIVTVLTAGETNGLPCLTIAFVDGESLRTRLARARRTRDRELLATPDTSRHASRALLLAAEVEARLGEHERAISLLKGAFAKGEPFTFWLHLSPAFEPLRERPDYREITKLRN